MNTRQAKISVETMKEVANDKTLKTKGDKDRRLREKKQNNTKKFMEERKMAQMKQNKDKEKLKKKHEKETEDLSKDVQSVSCSSSCLCRRGISSSIPIEQKLKPHPS